MIGLKHDIRFQQKLREKFGHMKVHKAINWAVESASRKAATAISRDVRGTYNIKAGQIKQHLRIHRVLRDATRALLYTGKSLPLVQFEPKAKTVRITARSKYGKPFATRRKGVTLRIRKDTGRQLVAKGWHAKDHILRRANSADNNADPRIQYGPSIPGMVAHPDTINMAQELVRQDLPVQFSKRLEYLIGLGEDD